LCTTVKNAQYVCGISVKIMPGELRAVAHFSLYVLVVLGHYLEKTNMKLGR